MPVKRIVQGAGIVTDPSALSAEELASGAMRQADNVMMHRSGALQPRPGFGDTTGVGTRSTAFRPVALWPYVAAEKVVVQSYSGAAWRLELLDADTRVDTTSADCRPPSENTRGTSSAIESRRSLWYTSSTGVRKVTISGTTTALEAGVWQTYQSIGYSLVDVGGANTDRVAIDSTAADATVAYRWLVRREDATGYVMRSAPSSRRLVTATMATYANGVYVQLGSLVLPDEAIAGDVIELYRTPNAAADPGEDYYLCGTYELTAADITAQVIADTAITDDVADSNLGVALYTSSSQLGALAAKAEPPVAHSLAWWNTCAWAGNVQTANALRLTLTKVGYESTTDRLEGVGLMFNETMTGDFVSGSPTVSNVTFGTDMTPNDNGGSVVGMWISDSAPLVSAGVIPTGTKITGISGSGPYTLTMSQNAAADSSSQTFKIGDVVTIDGLDFHAYDTQIESVRAFLLHNTDALADRVYETSVNLAACVAYQAALGNIDCTAIKDEILGGGDGSILLVSRSPRTYGTFTVTCSVRPTAWAEADIETGLTSPTEVHSARLHYSAPDEPAAWPPAQYERIGLDGYAILALVPLNDALLVFKEDGVFRIAGSPPNGWIVDKLDTRRLLAPECACVLDGVCYAWTDRGVLAYSEGGPGPVLSNPIAHHLREAQRVLPLDPKGTRRGFWMQAHPRLGLVVLNYASDIDSEVSDLGQWVLHVHSGAWSTWSRTSDRCSAYDVLEDRLLIGYGTGSWSCLYERSDEDAAASYRDQVTSAITPSSWTSTTVAVVAKTDVPWTPSVCDVVELPDHGTYHAVTAVVDGGSTWTITFSPAAGSVTGCEYVLVDESGDLIVDESGDGILLSSGSCDLILHEGYASTMLWQAAHIPGLGGRWQEIHAHLLDSSSGLRSSWALALGGQADGMAAPESTSITVASSVSLSRPVRTGMPRNTVRSTEVYPYAKHCGAGVLWRLSELALHATPTTRKVSR